MLASYIDSQWNFVSLDSPQCGILWIVEVFDAHHSRTFW